MNFNLPNILTLIRIGLIPIFVVLYYIPMFGWNNVVVTVIFALAGFTDWLDGYLARKLDQQSKFGAFLDPVADKLMVGTALVLLVGSHPGPWMAIPAVIIVGREIAISALREWMANIGDQIKVAVNMIGKIKTTAQMLAIGAMLYREPILEFPTLEVGFVLLYLSAGLTLWSMLIYLRGAWPSLMNNSGE